ncbi:hypothetical protein JCM10908_006993 [Rhodotorula pacifica]|uniref:U2 snRNP complex subunit CUS2 n=1 Tax=Rhodotorula pacifica TaxID=1495444 RepID=UPI00316B2332
MADSGQVPAPKEQADAPPPAASSSSSSLLPSTSSSNLSTEAAAMSSAAAGAPEPYFDRQVGKWMIEDATGTELEWDAQRNAWVPALTEDVVKAQQAAYSVEGVDEEAPVPGTTKEERKNKKKRKGGAGGDGEDGADSKPAKKPRGNTAVFVSQLPASTTVTQLSETFSKAGLILEDVSGEPKIKLYRDENGRFKGEALIVYLQEASVELACRLFDETELVLGSGDGVMSVKVAQWDKSKKTDGGGAAGQTSGSAEAGPSGTRNGEKPNGGQPDRDKARQGKRAAALRQKLEDWSSDEEDAAATAARARKYRGIVVLEGMFTLQELEDDPTLLLDLKEDVREECETLGEVTNVTLYDKEEKGIMTVRFKDELAAEACILKMNGRFFAGQTVSAYPMSGKIKLKKSGAEISLEGTGLGDPVDETASAKERERLEKYADWLEKGGE